LNPVLSGILETLNVEDIEENIYRGQNADTEHVFGGQVLAQAIASAYRTVDESQGLHSIHGYFLRAGDWQRPILYEVDRIRDGGSFSTRRVVAIQHGRAIFSMSSSWQRQEDGPEHTLPMPFKHTWMRCADRLPDDREVHLCMLAYMSDMDFMSTSMMPHGRPADGQVLQGASLDHAMWLHRPFRADEWLLFAKASPNAGGARGFVRGHFFDREGQLVATAAQEALIRVRPAPPAT